MKFPARLHVLLARDRPYGVIIRRGPAKSVCTIGWNRAKDEFRLGQWMRGRIYEERCDLSFDGKYFLYFALTGKWSGETRGSYTAISRAPYLKAISLYPQGDTWGGGGMFTGPRGYAVIASTETPLRESRELSLDREARPGRDARLARDGWRAVGEDRNTYEQDVPRQCWLLRKYLRAEAPAVPGRGCLFEEHALVHVPSGRILHKPEWEWAAVDGERLVWATAGRLYAAGVGRAGLGPETQLADFNDMKFEAIQAPY